MDDFYTLEQAAEKLGVNIRYASEQVQAGNLKATKIGKRIYVLHSDLIDFIKNGNDAKR